MACQHSLKCDFVQAYLLGWPVLADDLVTFLKKTAMSDPLDNDIDTLLIVDDEANILAALTRLFRRDGYQLLRAESGQAALNILAVQEVGVIVSDQRMPEMNGVQFLSKARERWPDTVRIMLSGYTELSSVTASVNEGAIHKFLTKPWDDDVLRETVREAFQLYRVTRENTRLNAALKKANEALTQWNHELEQRVADKTREALRNLNILRASQEILAHLPMPVLGIDPDGYLVMVNQAAESQLDVSAAFLGELAADVLPAGLLDASPDNGTEGRGCLPDGRKLRFWRYALGTPSTVTGTALVIHHIDPKNLQ